MDSKLNSLIRRILSDIRVELADQFDQNFTRQSFFSEPWPRRRSPLRQGKPLLIATGQLRRSIRAVITSSSITFQSNLPYAATHNQGATIRVTPRMRSYFWHRYYDATSAFGRRKDGTPRRDKRTIRLSTEAEFWRFMALKKVGSPIVIPRRPFLGFHPQLEQAVQQIIQQNLTQFFEQYPLDQ